MREETEIIALIPPALFLLGVVWRRSSLFLYLRQVPPLVSPLLQLHVPQSPRKLSFSLPVQTKGGNGFAPLLVLATWPAPVACP